MDHDKWIGAGERMGLTGSELQEYVEKREREFLTGKSVCSGEKMRKVGWSLNV